MKHMKVTIDPRIEYRYATFYLLGLEKVCPNVDIIYDIHPFEDISSAGGMALVIECGKNRYHVFIDFNDPCNIMEEQYQWAHLYCKINVRFGDSKRYGKLMVIGPSFGIQKDGLLPLLTLCLKNLRRSKTNMSLYLSTFLREYFYTIYRREKYDRYGKEIEIDDNYVFHASTLWYDKDTDATTNRYRGDFLQCCRDLGVRIGGGLFYIDNPVVLMEFPNYASYLEKYKGFLYKKRLSMQEYINETKRSFVVFNTPSVAGCHGWKLPEYLCMGKAIISTPLSREMPGEGLVHGENIHIVNSTEEIREAISQIRDDKTYRQRLMEGAKKYYEDYLAPEVVIQRIIDRCEQL